MAQAPKRGERQLPSSPAVRQVSLAHGRFMRMDRLGRKDFSARREEEIRTAKDEIQKEFGRRTDRARSNLRNLPPSATFLHRAAGAAT